MKRALVLSGGGSHGAYQVGAIKALTQQGKTYDVVAGISVGAINALWLGMNKKENQKQAALQLENLWNKKIDGNSSIYKPWYFYGLNYLAFFWKGSLNQTAPLRKLLESEFDVERVLKSDVEILVGAVSLNSGLYKTVTSKQDPSAILDWVMASSSMPIIFNPIKIGEEYWVDGGVRNITPISDIIKGFPEITEIDVVLADTLAPVKKMTTGFTNGIKVGTRTLSIMVDEIMRTDLEYCGEIAPHVTVSIHAPINALTYESFSFNRKDLSNAIELGYKETITKTM